MALSVSSRKVICVSKPLISGPKFERMLALPGVLRFQDPAQAREFAASRSLCADADTSLSDVYRSLGWLIEAVILTATRAIDLYVRPSRLVLSTCHSPVDV